MVLQRHTGSSAEGPSLGVKATAKSGNAAGAHALEVCRCRAIRPLVAASTVSRTPLGPA